MGVAAVGLFVGAGGCGGEDDERADADAGDWKPWVLRSGAEVMVAPPPKEGSAAARRDDAAFERAVRRRTAAQERKARVFARAPVVRPWLEQNMELVARRPKDVPASSRAYSNVSVAMADAAIAAAHWQSVYDREPPDADALVPAGDSSYPSEHAAIAGAASRVLAYLYPQYPRARLDERAEAAARARVAAGASRPSDVAAGLELGRAVADRVIAQARRDGSTRRWNGRRPHGPEHWEPPPGSRGQPNQPLAGTWKTWVVGRPLRFRPPAPPRYGSRAFLANARDVMRVQDRLTPAQRRIARFWAAPEGTPLPAGVWNRVVFEHVKDKDLSVPRQARTFALLNVAMADAGSVVWASKFLTGWWDPRPTNAIRDLGLDRRWKPLLPTPLFPAYPSGTSGYSGAASEVMAHLFPDDADLFRRRGREAGYSRLWGGVHWRIDVTQGLRIGRQVAGVVVRRAERDGAE